MAKFITVREYAIKFSYRETYVYKLCQEGKLPAKRKDGRWMIPVDAKRRDTGHGPKPRTLV